MPSPNQVVFKIDAAEELLAISEWYEAVRPGYGNKFIAAVDDCLKLVLTHPLANERVRKNYRRASLTKFPYAIYYRFEDGVVTVYTVFHCAQNPRKLRKRLP